MAHKGSRFPFEIIHKKRKKNENETTKQSQAFKSPTQA